MLKIRRMTMNDIDPVLNLLKVTFPEDHYTREWWSWKYENNPHGIPVLLVAEEDAMVIGLRAFWPRAFLLNGRKFVVHQAVDTAVHPQARGKGVFTKLTQVGLDLLREQHSYGVFNFPNFQSGPGYIKLGWRQVRRIRWWIRIIPNHKWISAKSVVDADQVQAPLILNQKDSPRFLQDQEYVVWRYQRHPFFRYEFWDLGMLTGERLYAVTRIVHRKAVSVRVVIDVLGNFSPSSGNTSILNLIVKGVPVSPFRGLCILDSSLGCSASSMLRAGFVPIPRMGTNHYIYPLCQDQQVVEALERMYLFPGDMDTF